MVPQASIKIGFALVVEKIVLDATLTAVSAELHAALKSPGAKVSGTKKKISQRCKLNPKRRHHRIDPSRLQDQFQQH